MVGRPAKVIRPTAFFSKKKTFFVRLLSQPSAGRLAGWHKHNDVKIKHIYIYYIYIYIYIYIYMSTKTLIIDLAVALEVQTFLIYTEML